MNETTTKPTQDFIEDVSLPRTGHVSHEVNSPLWHSLKRWPKVVMYNLALSSAILLYGYDLVIVGTVSAMPAFQ